MDVSTGCARSSPSAQDTEHEESACGPLTEPAQANFRSSAYVVLSDSARLKQTKLLPL